MVVAPEARPEVHLGGRPRATSMSRPPQPYSIMKPNGVSRAAPASADDEAPLVESPARQGRAVEAEQARDADTCLSGSKRRDSGKRSGQGALRQAVCKFHKDLLRVRRLLLPTRLRTIARTQPFGRMPARTP